MKISQIFFLFLISGYSFISIIYYNSTSDTILFAEAKIKNIKTKNAYKLIENNKKNKNFVILDIRTAQEYSSSHIENSINIDYYLTDFEENIDKLDRDKTYFVYCRSGNRSGRSMSIFKKLGFQDVYNLSGGITKWIKKGYPVIK